MLVYQLIYASDIKHWLGGFLMLSFPLIILGNVFFMITWLMGKSWKSCLPILTILIAYPFLERTFRLNPKSIFENTSYSFSVLSYNVMYCDSHNYFSLGNKSNGQKLVNSIDTLSADIKCFQELYVDSNIKEFDLLKRLSKRNPYYTYMHSTPGNEKGEGSIGLAIFSKFPIINKKELHWKPNNNGILAADIVVDKDTIRVINVQLKSMGIRVDKLLKAKNLEVKHETKNVIWQLKDGFEDRGVQVEILEDWVKNSPYPVIIGGDFNEMPYGYAYGRIRKLLRNSFEENGYGFGFTYHKILTFLRIDNLFFDTKNFTNIGFKTFKEIPYSDHYPVKAWYLIK